MIKIVIISTFLILGTVGCNQGGGGSSQGNRTGQDGGSTENVQNQTVAKLKQEVLSKASACSSALKENYEKQIATQEKRGDTEAEFKNSLRNMKKQIKC